MITNYCFNRLSSVSPEHRADFEAEKAYLELSESEKLGIKKRLADWDDMSDAALAFWGSFIGAGVIVAMLNIWQDYAKTHPKISLETRSLREKLLSRDGGYDVATDGDGFTLGLYLKYRIGLNHPDDSYEPERSIHLCWYDSYLEFTPTILRTISNSERKESLLRVRELIRVGLLVEMTHDYLKLGPPGNNCHMYTVDYNAKWRLSIFDYFRLLVKWLHGRLNENIHSRTNREV